MRLSKASNPKDSGRVPEGVPEGNYSVTNMKWFRKIPVGLRKEGPEGFVMVPYKLRY